MHSTKVWIRILLFVAWAAGLQSAWAAPGDQDTSFGDDGWVITDLGGDETGTAVAVQPSGRIILAGTRDSVNEDFALVGYFENGTLDQSFGDQGSVAIDFRGKDDSARDVMVLPEGSIVVAGTAFTDTNQDFALAGLTPSGILDPSFGSGGLITTDFSGNADQVWALALQPDGKIIAAGSSFNETNTDIALARYTAEGILDSSFGTGGRVVLDSFGRNQEARAVILQPDGKIVAAGFTFGEVSTEFILVRVNPDGSPDTSFGDSGFVITDFQGNNDRIWDLFLQDDGKILAAGSAFTTLARDFALARYAPDGSLDTTFGDQGLVTTDFAGFNDEARVILQQNSTIIALGSAFTDLTRSFALARYDANGRLDPSFGTQGRVTTNFNTRDSRLHDAALETNGTIVAGGESIRVSRDFTLTRFMTTEPVLDNGNNGTITVNGGGCIASANADGASALLLLLMLVIVWQKREKS